MYKPIYRMNEKCIEQEITCRFSVGGLINYFKLADRNIKLNVKLNDAGIAKLKTFFDYTGIGRKYIISKYGICDYNARQVLAFRNRTPLMLVMDSIVKFHAKRGSGRDKIIADVKFFLENVNVFSCMGSFDTMLPKRFSSDLFYMTGLIMGDGCIPMKFNKSGRQYEVFVEKANYPFIKGVVAPLFKSTFMLKNVKIRKQLTNIDKTRYRAYFMSRIVYETLNKIFGIPAGKKSHIIRFPPVMEEMPFEFRMALFSGLVDTDWGRIRWNRFGTHMSSECLSKDYLELFRELDIELNVKRYVQKGKFVSYQCFMKKGDEAKLLDALNQYYPLKNTRRIKTISCQDGGMVNAHALRSNDNRGRKVTMA